MGLYLVIVCGILAWLAYHKMLGLEDPKPIVRRKKQRYYLFLIGATIYIMLKSFAILEITTVYWIKNILAFLIIVTTSFCFLYIYEELLPVSKNYREKQKNKKFQEIENKYLHSCDRISVKKLKAIWLTSRGNYHYNLDEIDEAITDFKESLDLDVDNISTYKALGLCYESNQQIFPIEKSINIFKDGLIKCNELKLLTNEMKCNLFRILFILSNIYIDFVDLSSAHSYLYNQSSAKQLKSISALILDYLVTCVKSQTNGIITGEQKNTLIYI